MNLLWVVKNLWYWDREDLGFNLVKVLFLILMEKKALTCSPVEYIVLPNQITSRVLVYFVWSFIFYQLHILCILNNWYHCLTIWSFFHKVGALNHICTLRYGEFEFYTIQGADVLCVIETVCNFGQEYCAIIIEGRKKKLKDIYDATFE